jgi:hypothetical protein
MVYSSTRTAIDNGFALIGVKAKSCVGSLYSTLNIGLATDN